MLISQSDDLVISAQHGTLPDSFIIEIEASKVPHLISEFDNDFVKMANFLKIMNKRMVLLNPVSIIILTVFRNLSINNRLTSTSCKVRFLKMMRPIKSKMQLKRQFKLKTTDQSRIPRF